MTESVVVAGLATCQGDGNAIAGEGHGDLDTHRDWEVSKLQNARNSAGVLRERGRRGLPCDELYRQLFNPQLYLLGYGRSTLTTER